MHISIGLRSVLSWQHCCDFCTLCAWPLTPPQALLKPQAESPSSYLRTLTSVPLPDETPLKKLARVSSRSELLDTTTTSLLELMNRAWEVRGNYADTHSPAVDDDRVLVWAGLRIRCGVASGVESTSDMG